MDSNSLRAMVVHLREYLFSTWPVSTIFIPILTFEGIELNIKNKNIPFLKILSSFFCCFFFAGTGVWTQGFKLAKETPSHLSNSTRVFLH
jgi:hypothetical protein